MDRVSFEKIVEACRLPLEDDSEKILSDLNEILEVFDKIDKCNVADEPAFHPVGIPQKLREDIPKTFDNVDKLLENTSTYRFYVVGPKI